MKTAVLDTSALLAYFFDEAGAEKVEEIINKATEADRPIFISTVNWAEVLYKMQRKHGKQGFETAQHFERTTAVETFAIDREMAESAAMLKEEYGLGLADAFAAALAKHKKAELITGDLEFKSIEKEIKINWLK